jgi:hypothetical protein
MEKSDDAGFFYSPKRMSTHVAGRDFHVRANGVASLREGNALCHLPSYEGRNRRRNGERFIFNRNSFNRKIRFTHPNEKTKPHDRENKYSEYQQSVRIFGRPQSITFKNEMLMGKSRKERMTTKRPENAGNVFRSR